MEWVLLAETRQYLRKLANCIPKIKINGQLSANLQILMAFKLPNASLPLPQKECEILARPNLFIR